MKSEFKNYDRQYECVFTGDDLIKKKCDIEKIGVFSDEYNVTEYINMLKEVTGNFDMMIFDFLVKYEWLIKKFCYKGNNRKNSKTNGVEMDRAFGVFIRYYVGFENRMTFHSIQWMSKIIDYLYDFFPNFQIGNPFEEKYEYPFEFMNLGCLFLVYQMEERMELLNYGEKKKMNNAEFSDYVLNYINCYNEENEANYFIFHFSNKIAPHIRRKGYGKK